MQSLDEDSAFELETLITRNMLDFVAAKRSALSRASSTMSNVTLVDGQANPITDPSILSTMVILEATPTKATQTNETNEIIPDVMSFHEINQTPQAIAKPTPIRQQQLVKTGRMVGLRPPQPSLQSFTSVSAFASSKSHATDTFMTVHQEENVMYCTFAILFVRLISFIFFPKKSCRTQRIFSIWQYNHR